MDSTLDPRRGIALDDYLVMEENSLIKHEYIAGEVYAMSGVTTRHNLINLNLALHLRAAAKAQGCRVFAADVKLRAAKDRIYYPDIIVACGAAASVDLIVEKPSLIIEVTSPSTRATDRREKLDTYRRIPSLRMYLIVEQRRRHVLAYTRGPDGDWSREEIQGDGEIAVPPLGLRLLMDQVYEDVQLPPLTVREGEEWDDEWGEEEPADSEG